jgi:DNA-binding transcriptional LysR family regulator
MARDNLSDLSIFLAVAREGNFTRAAAKLGMSQPAISQTIRELE